MKGLKQARDKLKRKGWINDLDYDHYKTYDQIKDYRNLNRKINKEARFYFDKFDVEDMNFRMRKLPRIYKERYEQELRPTMRQIKIIKRKYVVFRKSKKK